MKHIPTKAKIFLHTWSFKPQITLRNIECHCISYLHPLHDRSVAKVPTQEHRGWVPVKENSNRKKWLLLNHTFLLLTGWMQRSWLLLSPKWRGCDAFCVNLECNVLLFLRFLTFFLGLYYVMFWLAPHALPSTCSYNLFIEVFARAIRCRWIMIPFCVARVRIWDRHHIFTLMPSARLNKWPQALKTRLFW